MSAEHRCERGPVLPLRHLRAVIVGAVALLWLLVATPALASGLGFGGPQVDLNSLQCATPGNCTAVGTYYDLLGHGQPASWTEINGHWRRGVELHAPANAALNGFDAYGNGGGLTGLSCPAARNCSAIGEYLDPYGNMWAALFSEHNGRWRTVAARMPSDVFQSHRRGPNPTGSVATTGVSCTSIGDCVAVGYYLAKHGAIKAVTFLERSGSWSPAIVVPGPTGSASGNFAQNELTAVNCPVTGACTAVGTYTDASGRAQGWAVTITGGGVQSSRPLAMPSGPDSPDPSPTPQLTSVSCVSATQCAAAGNYTVDYAGHSNGNLEGVTLLEQAGTWSATEVKLPANASPISTPNSQDSLLLSVDCPDASNCSAVGYYSDNNSNLQGEAVDATGGSWGGAQAIALPGNASTQSASQEVLPGPVSCSTATHCAASSVYVTTVGNYEPLLVFKAGSAWTSTPMNLPADAGIDQEVGGLAGVSCPAYRPPSVTSANDCTVVGIYQDRWNNIQGFATTEGASGTWGTPVELTAPGPSRAELRLSLRSILRPGIHSHMRRIARRGGIRFHYRAVEAGRLVITWRARIQRRAHLLAHASIHPWRAGHAQAFVHLTGYGRRAFKRLGRLRITASVVFHPRHGRTLTVRGAFVIRK